MAQYVADSQLPIDDGAGSEVITDEADFYMSNATEISTTGVDTATIPPVQSIEGNNVYMFRYKSALRQVIDVKKTKLRLTMKITYADGTNIPAQIGNPATDNPALKVLPVNNIGSALFNSCEVSINDQIIEGGDTMYAYKADIQTRLKNSKDVKDNQLKLQNFTNEYCKWDDLTTAEKDSIFAATGADYNNRRKYPFIERYLRSKKSKVFQVESDIYADFFREHKFLPPNTSLQIALTKQKDPEKFCLLAEEDTEYKIVVIKAELILKLKQLDQDFVDTSITNFRNGAPYRTEYTSVEIIRFATNTGYTDLGETDIFKLNSYSPERFVMVLVDQDAFNGIKNKDPFAYKRHGVKYFKLKRSDNLTRHEPVFMDRWGNDTKDILEGVSNLYLALDLYSNPEESIGIDMGNFDLGNFFMAFNLKKTEGQGVYSLPDKAVNSLEITCAALTCPIAKIVYAEFNTELLIDAFGTVTVRKNALA